MQQGVQPSVAEGDGEIYLASLRQAQEQLRTSGLDIGAEDDADDAQRQPDSRKASTGGVVKGVPAISSEEDDTRRGMDVHSMAAGEAMGPDLTELD